MSQITLSQYLEAYRHASKVYSGELSLAEAKEKLVRIGVNENSAVDLVRGYQKLRQGLVYKRALSSGTTDDFLEWILRDAGPDAHRLAVKSLEQHVKYYQGYSGSPMQSHVAILKKHRAISSANSSVENGKAFPQATTDSPPQFWIFQFNPDNNSGLEEDLRKGTVMTWHVGQHRRLVKPGQKVFLWRAAGKKKRPSGLIASGLVQTEPTVQRQYTKHLGEQPRLDPGKPELCVPIKIERVFREGDAMLHREGIKSDPALKDLEILTMARQTNYPISAAHGTRLSELVGANFKPVAGTYKDFGEAPNDDPGELRDFAAKVRRGQPQFRNKLLQLYNSKCAITGTEVQEVLEACHILLHSISGINHSANGILLRSDVHVLFDQELIMIDPKSMSVLVSADLMKSDYGRYHGQKLAVRSDGSQISQEYLNARYKGDKLP